MVARDDEFRRALPALDASAEVRGVALVGEAGVGKSTLARTVAKILESDQQAVRFVLGTETGRDVTLGAFYRLVTLDAAHEPAVIWSLRTEDWSSKKAWSSSWTTRSCLIHCRRRWCTNTPPIFMCVSAKFGLQLTLQGAGRLQSRDRARPNRADHSRYPVSEEMRSASAAMTVPIRLGPAVPARE